MWTNCQTNRKHEQLVAVQFTILSWRRFNLSVLGPAAMDPISFFTCFSVHKLWVAYLCSHNEFGIMFGRVRQLLRSPQWKLQVYPSNPKWLRCAIGCAPTPGPASVVACGGAAGAGRQRAGPARGPPSFCAPRPPPTTVPSNHPHGPSLGPANWFLLLLKEWQQTKINKNMEENINGKKWWEILDLKKKYGEIQQFGITVVFLVGIKIFGKIIKIPQKRISAVLCCG